MHARMSGKKRIVDFFRFVSILSLNLGFFLMTGFYSRRRRWWCKVFVCVCVCVCVLLFLACGSDQGAHVGGGGGVGGEDDEYSEHSRRGGRGGVDVNANVDMDVDEESPEGRVS